MNRLLKAKVALSKPLWLIVTLAVFACLSRAIIAQKANDTFRIYDLWLVLFRPELYGISKINVYDFVAALTATSAILALAMFTGWIVAAIVGSVKLLITNIRDKDRTTA